MTIKQARSAILGGFEYLKGSCVFRQKNLRQLAKACLLSRTVRSLVLIYLTSYSTMGRYPPLKKLIALWCAFPSFCIFHSSRPTHGLEMNMAWWNLFDYVPDPPLWSQGRKFQVPILITIKRLVVALHRIIRPILSKNRAFTAVIRFTRRQSWHITTSCNHPP